MIMEISKIGALLILYVPDYNDHGKEIFILFRIQDVSIHWEQP